MRPILFLMLGYPGSGKSTFAKALASEQNIVRINSDELRLHMFARPEDIQNQRNNGFVFGAMDYMAKTLLDNGVSVIYDANNNRATKRKTLKKLARSCGAHSIVVWVQASVELSKAREIERRKNKHYLPIPTEPHDRLIRNLEPPKEGEQVIKIDGAINTQKQLSSFHKQLSTTARS